jgi:rubrerythrin
MEGGINAWNGAVAEGLPEQGLSFFATARSAEEYIALAWLLEDGTNMFYRRVSEMSAEHEAAALFEELSVAEEHHKALLDGLSFRFSRTRIDPDSRRSAAFGLQAEHYIEGGLRLDEAIHQARGRKAAGILEMSITLEANAFDRYLFMRQEVRDARVKEVFTVLSNEEKRHLERLSGLTVLLI